MSDKPSVRIGNALVGADHPVYVIAEIGINHNGELSIAKSMIDGAAKAGCNAVKFQKRTPEVCVPKDQWAKERETPWGVMTYIDYRHRMEFTAEQFAEIDAHCKALGLDWFVSCWDQPSVDFMEPFNPPAYKAASASLTDLDLLRKMKDTGRPLIISTGMSTQAEIDAAVAAIGTDNLLIAHATSTYPCPPQELNLRMIHTLQAKFPNVPIGYSGHEPGLTPTWAAVALGACFVERHITLDRTMWGTDQAASVEIAGLIKLVQDIRDLEQALGDGIKRVYPSEESSRAKLRIVPSKD